jgi:UDP-glucose 4-epimerase
LNVLEACSKYNVQNLVFDSSADIYGHTTILPIPEDISLEPISPYGANKVAAEALVFSFRSKIKNCLFLRFFNIYGEDQTMTYAGRITKFITSLVQPFSSSNLW